MADGKAPRRCMRQGTAIVHPKGVEERYDISGPTRWRWEKTGKLPPRDVFIGGEPRGWRLATLEAAETNGAA